MNELSEAIQQPKQDVTQSFQVRVRDRTHSFREPGHFLQWLQGEEETSADVCVRGVPARGGAGSQEVTDFIFKELRLAKLPGRWQKRALQYLKNRCGHQFSKEEAVCEAREEYHRKEREEESCSKSLVASRSCTGMGSSSPPDDVKPCQLTEGYKRRSEPRGDTLLWELSPRSDLLSPANQPAAATAEADVSPAIVS